MAIVNKQKYLSGISALVGKGSVHFEEQERPAFEMGGRQVFVTSVSYDYDTCDLTYRVCNSMGMHLPSAHGERPLSQLGVRLLGEIAEKARMKAELRKERSRNLVAVESRARNAKASEVGHGITF